MPAAKSQSIKAAAGSFIGTTIEWYDFYCYGLAAALVFGPLFFSGSSPYIATLSAFGTFAVGFFGRPLGGLVFGHFGDRVGRKNILVTTLVMMGCATVGIGLLPTYAQIGIWAPILLVVLRVFQGIAVGGEWGGAVLLAAEHAPKGRQTFFASFAQLGSPAGLILALLAFRVAGMSDQATFMSWGWRVPFLVSIVLLGVGLIIRLNVDETPEFEDIKKRAEQSTTPAMELLREWRLPIILAMGANTFGIASVYFYSTFMIAYATQYVGIPRSTILDALFWAAVVQLLSQPIGARIAEKFGKERLFLQLCLTVAMLTPYPLFLLVGTGNFWLLLLGLVVNTFAGAFFYAVIAGYISKIFPTRVRYSAISIAYQFCGAAAGGLTPVLGTVLAENYKGEWWPLALFASALAGVSLICVTLIKRYQSVPDTVVVSPHGDPVQS
ncbi:Putative transporter protein (plasmid) [Neorhizobium galegae bv. officinalis bv. officinalis str. HAMBI 1141]|uniref:Putative transporter protein n=1 Tax=Neorhizobium galegae bv. officinalis bv. officinalis str. HAMBI 1141 TaxID=1028801 RepID=A0A068TJE0_NEOGA|nr:MFS transporter [Neorhizobium galegae]CDN57635.1 Putative transporter protein [Neorhizobium galegae bv. officinalis bv. officinalis str. HAMBI 1141]